MSGLITAIVVALHVVVCVALMVSILLQSGTRGGGLAGAFGAGSSQTLFGGRGAASFLTRATTVLAVIFFVTSLTLGLQASRSGGTRESFTQQEARKRGAQRGTDAGSQPGPTAGAPAAPSPTTAPGSTGAPAGPLVQPATPPATPGGGGGTQPPTSTTK